jgi:uncharacterized protein (DUF427 family)
MTSLRAYLENQTLVDRSAGQGHKEEDETMQDQASSSGSYPSLEGAIRNQGNPDHLMVIRPVRRTVRVYIGDTLIAQTHNALRVMEMGKSLYDPALYIPVSDLVVDLDPVDKSTHCPLKGDASYLAMNGAEIAWTYDRPLEGAQMLEDHLAFWPDKVRIAEGD